MEKKNNTPKVNPSGLVKEEIERRHLIGEAFEKFNQTLQQFRDFQHKLEQQIRDLREELSLKNQEMHNILESLNSGLIVTDLAGRVLSFNKAAFHITNFSPSLIENKELNQLFQYSIIPKTKKDALDLSKIVNNYQQQFSFNRSANETLFLETSTSLMRSAENQENLGIIVNLVDVTLIKHLEEEAERKKRLAAMGQIAATLAHEIRNPLGGIELFVSLLAKDLKDNPEHMQAIARIQSATKSMNHVISNILEYSKNRNFKKTKLDLVNLINEFCDFFQEHSKLQNVKLKLNTKLKQAFIAGEKELLKQSLQNLYMNALQSMLDGGEININLDQITLTAPEDIAKLTKTDKPKNLDAIKLSVQDQGEGISPANQKKILDPFFTTKPNGTGLGLSIVKQVIDAHDGYIEMLSTPNKGTTISLYFKAYSP